MLDLLDLNVMALDFLSSRLGHRHLEQAVVVLGLDLACIDTLFVIWVKMKSEKAHARENGTSGSSKDLWNDP